MNIVLAQQLEFERFGIEQGLSQGTIFSITQDAYGFLWMGTLDGLNRYDGYSFKVYKHNPNDSNTISSNNIYRVFPLRDGRIAVSSTHFNIDILQNYNPEIIQLNALMINNSAGSNAVGRSFYEDTTGHIWVGTDQGIIKFSADFAERREFIIADTSDIENIVFDLFCDQNKKIFGGLRNRLIAIDMRTHQVSFIPIVTKASSKYSEINLHWSARYDSVFLLGGDRTGLYYFDSKTNSIIQLPIISALQKKLAFTLARVALFDHTGMLWIGTDNGLFTAKVKTIDNIPTIVDIRQYQNDPTNFKSLSHNNVLSLFIDKEQTLWVGTTNGLNKLPLQKKKFSTYVHDPNNRSTIGDGGVWTFIEDRKRTLYVGTQHGYSTRKKGENIFTRFSAIRPINSSRDSAGTLWFGTRDELVQIIGGKITQRIKDDEPIKNLSRNFYSSIVASNNALWIGTSFGLVRFDIERKNFKRFLSTSTSSVENERYILSVLNRYNGSIWVGTNNGGLGRFNPLDSSFKFYRSVKGNPRSLSFDAVISLLETHDKTLWVATLGGGINKVIERTDDSVEFIHFREADGLPTDAVYGMLEDHQGNIWISTNNGITRFNPTTKTFRIFTSADGLQGDEFNQNAFYKSEDGKMYFGGPKGFTEFYPDSICDNSVLPNVAFTSFKIFEKDFSSFLNDSIIYLRFDQNFFSFEFTSLSFISPKHNRYMYQLEGLEKSWTFAGDRRTAHYTNIDPGEYTFRVRGTNNDGVWNMAGASIKIIIAPPWWATVWFKMFSAFGFIGSIVGGSWYVSRRKLKAQIAELERQKAILEERQRTRDRIARDLHDDLASTVGSAGLFIETAKRKLGENSEQAKDYLNKTSSLLNEAEEAMSDIVWSVSPKHDTLQSLATRIKIVAAEICRANGIVCIVEIKEGIDLPLSDDVRRGIYLIFKEALNNCVKHASAKNVSITIGMLNEQLILIVKDDGVGFSMESTGDKLGGNGMTNMRKRAEEIHAGIDIESKVGNGTTLTLFKQMTQLSH